MMGRLRWVTEKISAAITPVTATWTYIKTSATEYWHTSGLEKQFHAYSSGFTDYWHKSGLDNKFHDYSSHFWAGFSRILDPVMGTKLWSAKKTRGALWESAKEHVAFITPIIAYEFLFKGLLHAIPYMKDSPIEFVLDVAARAYFMRETARLFADEIAHNLNVTKAAADEQSISEHFQACPCDATKIIQSGLASPFYYLGKSATVQLIASYFPYGDYITFPLRTLVCGQGLLEYKLAAASICTTHRNEIINKNHAFTMGMGASYSAALWISNYLVRSTTGVDSWFVSFALSNFLYQYCIVAAYFQDKPLPGKEVSVDIFRPSKKMIESGLYQGANKLVEWLKTPTENIDWLAKIQETKKSLDDFTPTKYAARYFIHADFLQTPLDKLLDQLAMRPAYAKFIELHERSIYSSIDGVIAKRKEIQSMPFIDRIAKITPYIPDFILSQNAKQLLPIVADKKYDGVLEQIKARIQALPRRALTMEDIPEEVLRARRAVIAKMPPPSVQPAPAQENVGSAPVSAPSAQASLSLPIPLQPVATKPVKPKRPDPIMQLPLHMLASSGGADAPLEPVSLYKSDGGFSKPASRLTNKAGTLSENGFYSLSASATMPTERGGSAQLAKKSGK